MAMRAFSTDDAYRAIDSISRLPVAVSAEQGRTGELPGDKLTKNLKRK